MHAFIDELKKRRKFAIRLGKLADEQAHFSLRETIIIGAFVCKVNTAAGL